MTCRIRFVQSGGFAGLKRESALDDSVLSRPARQALKAALLLSPIKNKNPQGGDLMQYNITIRKAKKNYQLSFDDLSVPKEIRPLLASLKKASRDFVA